MLVEVKRVNKAEMTVVSSLDVSDTFDKNHRDVMESIRNIESTTVSYTHLMLPTNSLV